MKLYELFKIYQEEKNQSRRFYLALDKGIEFYYEDELVWELVKKNNTECTSEVTESYISKALMNLEVKEIIKK